jgi:hypothetical protein
MLWFNSEINVQGEYEGPQCLRRDLLIPNTFEFMEKVCVQIVAMAVHWYK